MDPLSASVFLESKSHRYQCSSLSRCSLKSFSGIFIWHLLSHTTRWRGGIVVAGTPPHTASLCRTTGAKSQILLHSLKQKRMKPVSFQKVPPLTLISTPVWISSETIQIQKLVKHLKGKWNTVFLSCHSSSAANSIPSSLWICLSMFMLVEEPIKGKSRVF